MVTKTMADNMYNSFTCNIKEFIIDEIALEGLEGIAPKLLWKRLEARISAPITEKMKIKYWNYILTCKSISIYKLPEPLPDIEVVNRLTLIDPETGYLKDPDDYLDGPYEYAPIENENGSSVHYNNRTLVTDETSLSYDNIKSEYGDHLALVASLEERWKALAPGVPLALQEQLVPLNFCMLELIGRSRENGQMTTGKSNLTKIVKDSKILFYHRKALQNLDIVRVTCLTQVTAGRAVKALLIRLKRFHKSDILTVPKSGLIRNIVDHLKTQPNFCDKTEMVIKKGLMSPIQSKRYQKKVSIFHFGETPITSNSILGASASSKTQISKEPKKVTKKRYMYLVSKSDESSQSEEEENSQPLKCQYKIGVNILRQAYERFLEAGRNGLTQLELAQLVGVEFYVSRSICRIFKSKNIIREFIECKGRQRMGRYIAIAATSKMDSKLAEEKKKLKKLLDEGNKLCKQVTKRTMSETSSDSEKLIVKKKRKMENNEPTNVESGIIEIKVIDGIKNSGINIDSKVSLRQLKFMNGILKVIHERTFVLGYQTLTNFVSAECNEPPMDTKAMKLLIQGMVTGGNLKVYRMKLPRSRLPFTVMICAPHIKPNNPLLQAKHKELVHKVNLSQKNAQKKLGAEKPLSQYAYPRYVKVQKLHQALVKIMYFNDVKFESGLPQGFFSLKDVIPELTVGVSLGHISSEGVVDIARFPIVDNLLDVKIRDAPTDLKRVLLKSRNLQASLRTILGILAQFGLVQLIVQSTANCSQVPDNTMTINMFYVNKHAKIIDTSGVWPREDAEVKEKEFYFENFEVVQEYWQAVYNISINSTIEVPNRRQKNIQFKAPVRTIEQALESDNGERFGNGKGPCGFDSLYYLEIPRLWKSYCIRSSSLESKLKKINVTMPKVDIPKRAKVQKRKKKSIKKTVVKKPVVAEVVKQAVISGDGIKKRPRHSKNWTLEDDRLLMMCKTAITIMSPISQPGSLRVRNIVAKDILSIRDPKKTQSVCHKRAALIEKNSTLVHERNCILNELRRHNRISKYEGLLKNIRMLYATNLGKYIYQARMPMMELVWILYQLSKNMSLMKVTPWVILSLEEFHEKYTIAASSTNQPHNLYTTPLDSGIRLATLKEAIMLTVMLSFNNVVNKETAAIVYSYFHKYPENDLRTAIEPLRKCGAIAAKDKMIRTQLQIVDLDDIVQCSYRISAVYQRKWISRLNSDFSDSVAEYFNGDVDRHAVKASPEANCIIFELQGSGILDIVAATVPVITGSSGSIIHEEQLNVIDIATNFKLKSGIIGWKNKSNLTSYSALHKNIKVNEALDYLSRRSFIPDEDIKKNYDLDHNILSYLEEKREKGATFKELKETLDYDWNVLSETLSSLQTKNIIKRIGFYENLVVLMKYVEHWCMMIPGGYMVPVPWLNLESKVRPDVFFKWAGVVMNKVFEYPGCSLSYLSESCEFLTVRAVQDICEMLQKCECVTLHTLLQKEPNLLFDDDDTCPELMDYNEFESSVNIFVMPTKDCVSKYSYIKNTMFINDDSTTISTQVSEDSQ